MRWTSAKDKVPEHYRFVNIIIHFGDEVGTSDYPMVGFLSEGNTWMALDDYGDESVIELSESNTLYWVEVPNWDSIGQCDQIYSDNAFSAICKLPAGHDGRHGVSEEQARLSYIEARKKGLVP